MPEETCRIEERTTLEPIEEEIVPFEIAGELRRKAKEILKSERELKENYEKSLKETKAPTLKLELRRDIKRQDTAITVAEHYLDRIDECVRTKEKCLLSYKPVKIKMQMCETPPSHTEFVKYEFIRLEGSIKDFRDAIIKRYGRFPSMLNEEESILLRDLYSRKDRFEEILQSAAAVDFVQPTREGKILERAEL